MAMTIDWSCKVLETRTTLNFSTKEFLARLEAQISFMEKWSLHLILFYLHPVRFRRAKFNSVTWCECCKSNFSTRLVEEARPLTSVVQYYMNQSKYGFYISCRVFKHF
uniref:Uncharacterized protein n=1 Tax=Cacopsylla melanoneura TaxID=428564 RepID=A0A8D8WY46_9HEMI